MSGYYYPRLVISHLFNMQADTFINVFLKITSVFMSISKLVLHAKTAVIDDIWSTVGSTNLDRRSFNANLEVNAIILVEFWE